MPLVDVITPVKNTPSHYLSTAIESVLSQTVNDYQIIIINDGSSTNYREDLVKYLSRLNNDKIFLLENLYSKNQVVLIFNSSDSTGNDPTTGRPSFPSSRQRQRSDYACA